MSKMTIEEAARYFGVSKEAIHNRIRRGSLKSEIKDGIKHVLVDKKSFVKSTQAKSPYSNKRSVFHDERYYRFLEEQNSRLQSRVEMLECETRTLRDQKEEMLIEEKKKIEQIYKEKDEQLKNILNVISSKFMLDAPSLPQEEEHLDVEIEEDKSKSNVVSLKKFLKHSKFSNKKIKKIQSRFKKTAKDDERILTIGKKYYMDMSKYDYKDLLR